MYQNLFHLSHISCLFFSVQFLQLVCIFTDLVPKILLHVLTQTATSDDEFRSKCEEDRKWDSADPKHRDWLSTLMKRNGAKKYCYDPVRDKPATEWDVITLNAALYALMNTCYDSNDMEKRTKKKTASYSPIGEVADSRNSIYHRAEMKVPQNEFIQQELHACVFLL